MKKLMKLRTALKVINLTTVNSKKVYIEHILIHSIAIVVHNELIVQYQSKREIIYWKLSETKLHRERLIAKMGTKEYKDIASKRAGVEGIPSVLRRKYGIDHLPVRGKVRSKVWLGFKVAAINCKRLIKGL